MFEVGAGGKLRCFSQFIFAHDAFVQLIAIPESGIQTGHNTAAVFGG